MGYNPPGTTKIDPTDPQTIDEAWIQDDMFPNLAAYAADATKSPYLEDYILEACAAINDMCNRKFNQQQQDQIFISKELYFSSYNEFVLDNGPLVSIDRVWLQIGDSFSEVSMDFAQIDTVSRVVKVLPNVANAAKPLVQDRNDTVNVWIRYTGGYEVDYSGSNTTNEVPRPVRRATAKYVDYLFASDGFTAGIKSYRTQTYSQTNATGNVAEDDPVLASISMILKPYMINSIIA